jgi:acid phosphatase (class A)
MKNLFLSLFVTLVACNYAPKHTETAVGTETSTDTVYSDSKLYESFKSDLSPAPSRHSDIEKADYKTLKQWNKHRTAENCSRANSELKVSLQTFFGPPYGPLTDDQLTKLAKIYGNLSQDTRYFVNQMKDDFARLRPYFVFTNLNPCIKKVDTYSYPSGHTTNAYVGAMVLSDILPSKQKELMARAEVIANDRVVAGVHYPSDIAAGKKLAQEIYDSMKKSGLYQKDVQALKSLLK